MSERTLLRRFTVAVLAASLLAPAIFAIAYLNIANLPPPYSNYAHVPVASIAYLAVTATTITLLLRRRLLQSDSRARRGSTDRFRSARRLAIDGVVGVALYVTGGVLWVGYEAQQLPGASLPLMVVVGIAATNIVNILIPSFLYLQDLLGRFFGPFAEGRTLVHARLRILAVGIGNTFVACTSFLIYQATYPGSVIADAWLIWSLVLIYAGTVSYIAYAGFAVSVAPLKEVLEARASDGRALQPRSIDEVGALMFRLKELLDRHALAQREVRASEARLRMFAEAASDYFFELDAQLRYSFFSDRFREITGVDPSAVIGIHPTELRGRYSFIDDSDLLTDLDDHRPFRNHHLTIRRRDGDGELHLEVSGVPYFDEHGRFCGYRCTGTDVTRIVEAQKALRINQAELAQAQKMEAVGQLTGGIAHDFNNLLTVIIGNLELLQLHAGDQPNGGRLGRHIDAALAAATRGGTLTQRLLAFSRRQALHPTTVDVAALLRDMQEMLRRTLGEDISIEVTSEPDQWRCRVDPHQLESAILNLALNARDAMAHGGRLSMQLRNRAAVPDDPNDWVQLRITDTGRGIAPDVLPHVFEPFFTTKGPGEGSGLGLSMVYGFITQSGGRIELSSTVGIGTTAQILLPRALAEEGASENRDGHTLHAGHGQTILVIEDDPSVTAVVGEGLRQLGYRVLHVDNGEEALRKLQEMGPVDLVLSDVVLPGGLSGLDVEDAIRRERPGVRFLFMSGYAKDEIERKGPRKAGSIELLRKPFQLTELADKVIEALSVDA